MKKLKIKKCMTSFLMLFAIAVSIVGVLPKSVAYADDTLKLPDFDFRIDDNKMDGSFQLFKWNPSCAGADTVSFWNSEKKEFCDAVISTSPLTDSYTYYKYSATTDGGSILMNTSENKCHSGSFEARGKKYYFVWYDSKLSNLDYGIEVKRGICFGSKEFVTEDSEKRICEYIISTLPTSFTVIGEDGMDTDEIPDGSSTKPIRDKSVGYPDVYDYKFLISSPSSHGDDGEHGEWDKLKNADYIKWKSKSTTGFNLIKPDSKYKNVYIQAKIVSRFQYNDSFWGNGDWHNYDNYGEEGYFDFINPSDKELTVTFQQLTELLPKTHAEKHHFKKYNFDYDYYFRIVYTRADDLKVIPTYYSGGWRRVSCHSNNGKHDENGEGENSSAVITDGDDEGGKWKTDKDSKDNDKNIDNGTGEGSDLDDAKDDADNKKKDTTSGSLDIDSVKGFMNEVGNVPKAIGKLFSFLPDWVTTFIGFGFVVLVALMIIKAIRG